MSTWYSTSLCHAEILLLALNEQNMSAHKGHTICYIFARKNMKKNLTEHSLTALLKHLLSVAYAVNNRLSYVEL